MASRSVAFEFEGPMEVEMDVEYSGDDGAVLPDDLEEIVKRYLLEVVAPAYIKEIEDKAADLVMTGTVNEWLNEDARDYADGYADYLYECEKDRRLGL